MAYDQVTANLVRENHRLAEALRDAQRAINSMKVEAETAAQGDEEMMLDACNTISQEGLAADMAIRAALGTDGVTAVQAPWVKVAEGLHELRTAGGTKPMQGLADWLRAVAETQAADTEQEACMRQWAREVDAACGVAGTQGDKA